MKSSYSPSEARSSVERYARDWGEDLALRVYTSRLLGRESSLVLHGGGNTSVKTRTRDVMGDEVDVICVKGSGWDLASIEPAGFPACRRDGLARLYALDDLSDEEMVAGLRSQMLDPWGPTPSVEALLHAYLPGKFVDHTHADAVLAVLDQPDSRELALEIWGEAYVFVPYVMPGFALASRVVAMANLGTGASGLVLDKHGIFTWGETAQESYESMIDAVSAAEAQLVGAGRGAARSKVQGISPGERRARQAHLAPIVRGAVARMEEGSRFVLEWRDEEEVLSLLAREDAAVATQIGTVTPDHVIRTRPKPLWLGTDLHDGDAETLADRVSNALEEYAAGYRDYFERASAARKRSLTPLDPLPRIVLVRDLGALCLGATLPDARIVGDIYAHTAVVIQEAMALGTFRPVQELDLFDVEYWSLEQAKLERLKAPARPLSDRVALVTGAAGGIGRATARHLLDLGAHVMVSDSDGTRLAAVAEELTDTFGLRVASTRCDVTEGSEVSQMLVDTVLAFGGLDVVVSNAGVAPSGLLHTPEGESALLQSMEINLLSHQRVARRVTDVLLRQSAGGCLLFNASKSAFNQGPGFGPYAIPKAGVLALMRQYAVDLGPHGIRANAVNADRIRTRLFDGGVLEDRARARGVSSDDYFCQNLLSRETTAVDVARVFAWLATADATTGCVVTVDGGNAAAFPR